MTPAMDRFLGTCMQLGAWAAVHDQHDETVRWLEDLLQTVGVPPGENVPETLPCAQLDALTAVIRAHGQAEISLPPED